jgi:hypothetical protein
VAATSTSAAGTSHEGREPPVARVALEASVVVRLAPLDGPDAFFFRDDLELKTP